MVPKGLHSKPKRLRVKWLAAAVSLAMVAVACSGDDTSTDPEPDSTTTTSVSAPDPTTTTTTEPPDQATATTTTTTTVPAITEDRAYYILPPGNYGGIPNDRQFVRPTPALRRPHPVTRRHQRCRHRQSFPSPEFRTGRRDCRGANRTRRHDDPLRRIRDRSCQRRYQRRPGLRRRLGNSP